jgi:hypothetical protein
MGGYYIRSPNEELERIKRSFRGMIVVKYNCFKARYLPVVSVEGMIVRDGRVLLLRRRFSPARGEWWFPGGRVRWGEGFWMLCVGRSWRRLGWRLGVAGLLGFILGFFLRGTM